MFWKDDNFLFNVWYLLIVFRIGVILLEGMLAHQMVQVFVVIAATLNAAILIHLYNRLISGVSNLRYNILIHQFPVILPVFATIYLLISLRYAFFS